MSRQILNDHPWTESEKKYQLSRGRNKLVERNARDFPPGSEPKVIEPEDESPKLDQDIFEKVNSLDMPELQEELNKFGLDNKGDPITLKKRLAIYLQSIRDQDDSTNV